jgi:hypothetical protein
MPESDTATAPAAGQSFRNKHEEKPLLGEDGVVASSGAGRGIWKIPYASSALRST